MHLITLLMLLAIVALPMQAQTPADVDQGIDFDFGITQEQFEEFTALAAQGIYATPVEPARARGLLGFDIGIAATAVPIDPDAGYWTRSTNDDFSISDHLAVPRLTASKGLSFGTISAMYAKVPDSNISVWGGSFDLPLTSGGIATPTIALRAAYSELKGVEKLALSTYGAELFVSKGFGPITPYVAAGYAKYKAEGEATSFGSAPSRFLETDGNMNRYTLGVRVSMFLPKLVVEATQAEERSYAAKISVGF